MKKSFSDKSANLTIKRLIKGGLVFLLALFGICFIFLIGKNKKTENKQLTNTNKLLLENNHHKFLTTNISNPVIPLTNEFQISISQGTSTVVLNAFPNNIILAKYELKQPTQQVIDVIMLHPNGTRITNHELTVGISTDFYGCSKTTILGNNFLTVWNDKQDDTENIYGSIFDHNEKLVRGSFTINSHPNAYYPNLIALSNDRYFIVWQNSEDPDFGNGVHANYFTPEGNPLFNELLISENAKEITYPKTAKLQNDYHIVVWLIYSNSIIQAQAFSPDGKKHGNLQKSLAQSQSQGLAGDAGDYFDTTGLLKNNYYIVTWGAKPTSDQNYHIYYRQLNQDGSPSSEILEATELTYAKMIKCPHTAGLSNGNFIIIWLPEETGATIYGQYFTYYGKKIGSYFHITQTMAPLTRGMMSIVALSNGTFTIAWPQRTDVGEYAIGRTFQAKDVSPQIDTNQLIINKKGSSIALLSDNLHAIDPDGPSSQIRFEISDPQYGNFIWVHNGQPTTFFYQQNITDNLINFIQDGTDNFPRYSVTAFDVTNLSSPTQAADITFYNDGVKPKIHDKPDLADVTVTKNKNFQKSTLGKFTVFDMEDLVVSFAGVGTPSLPHWLHFKDGIISGKPTEDAKTDSYALCATDTRPLPWKNCTTCINVRIAIQEPTHQPSKSDIMRVFIPVFTTTIGGTITISICCTSTIFTLLFYKYKKQQNNKESRKLNYFAAQLWHHLGEAKDYRDFSKEDGRVFISLVCGPIEQNNPLFAPFTEDNLANKLGINIPIDKKEKDKLAKNVAYTIKKVLLTQKNKSTFFKKKISIKEIQENLDLIAAEYRNIFNAQEVELQTPGNDEQPDTELSILMEETDFSGSEDDEHRPLVHSVN